MSDLNESTASEIARPESVVSDDINPLVYSLPAPLNPVEFIGSNNPGSPTSSTASSGGQNQNIDSTTTSYATVAASLNNLDDLAMWDWQPQPPPQ